MNLRQLAMFVGIVEEQSFNKAAQRLNATQSGLSMQIRNLEDHLGVTLLERSSRGAVPTAAGVKFYDRALAILRQVDEAQTELRTMSGSIAGPLRVGLMPTFTRGLITPVIRDYLEKYPHVELSVTEAYSGVLQALVAEGGVDFAVVPKSSAIAGLKTTFLGTDRELLVCRAGGQRQHLSPVCLSDLPPLKLVLPARGNARRDAIEAFIGETNLKIAGILEMDAMFATLELVAASEYVTILPATVCSRDIEGKERWLHPIVDPSITVNYALVEPAARALTPAAERFLVHLRAEYEASNARWQSLILA
ncbi:LysR family transcriptional regulator [Pelagibacterium montanilacus]|uniref:LysR family transcriptional regulator n=1 Tax=Pelagibacterium montanilacus TaxID=2185280 RepID=UPI000F8D8E31|nr:LysR family transcriptional regulator [Pelagibacterium montanilacus]